MSRVSRSQRMARRRCLMHCELEEKAVLPFFEGFLEGCLFFFAKVKKKQFSILF